MALAKVVNLAGATDKTVILNVRAGVVQPFVAPDWLDLRVGFLLSLTKAANDDDTTGLAETIGVPPLVDGPQDRYWIGVKDNSTLLPAASGSVFIGYCNAFDTGARKGTSILATSDNAIGTTNANFWRPTNGEPVSGVFASAAIYNEQLKVVGSTNGVQQHFAQSAVGAGGYATLLMLRLQRADANIHDKTVTVTMKQGTFNGDVLYTNTPTESLLQTNLASFPGTVQQLGPVTLPRGVPDSLFLYWPFHNSRLRIHAMGILKAR